jgi:hypothetical protein
VTVIVNNTGFNVKYWARFSEVEFVSQNIRQGVYKDRPEEDRRILLSQAYQLIKDDYARATKTA